MGSPWQVAVLCSLISATLANTVPVTMVALTLDDEVTTTQDPSMATATPDIPITMTEMLVHSEISMRYAHTAITTTVSNPGGKAQEYSFRVLLPDTAFISGFTMVLNTKVYDAFVIGKDEAKAIFSDAVNQGKGAAHVASTARNSNQFNVSVNVDPHSMAVFLLKYEELLTRRNGMYNHVLNLHPGGMVPKLTVTVHIKETQAITQLRVPELRTGNELYASEDDPPQHTAVVERVNNNEARITFSPEMQEQKQLFKIYNRNLRESLGLKGKVEGVLGQFVVQYDVQRPRSGEILVKDGHFVHFFAPPNLTPLSKHVVFVLDTSYSMDGTKISQMIEAILTILDEVGEQDYFHIVEFNSEITVHNVAGLGLRAVKATRDNIADAKNIILRLEATTATDIYGALNQALDLIQSGVEDSTTGTQQSEPTIIFLTDGEATDGVTDCKTIIEDITLRNSGPNRATIFTIAFGDDADQKFLRALSQRNNGFMRYVYEAGDAALQIIKFYEEISSPLLSHVKFVYPPDQVIASSLTKHEFRNMYAGSEVMVSGQMKPGATSVNGRIQAVEGNQKAIDLQSHVTKVGRGSVSLERFWVHLTIKQLLEHEDYDENGVEAVMKATDLAIEYSLVTPETSIVVVNPDGDAVVDVVPANSTVPDCVSHCDLEEDDIYEIVESSSPATVLSDPIERYKLVSFPWIEDLVDGATGTIKIDNVVLKLTTGDAILKPGDDEPCERGKCVYITRCSIGSESSSSWYSLMYCDVQGYAGICCPDAHITPR